MNLSSSGLLRLCLLLLVMATQVFGLVEAADEARVPLRVMSYNIRYGTAADGENHWDKRRERLIETIKAFHPDLLGTQETLGFQRDYLAQQLPEYSVLGVGRDNGVDKGEMMALYYRTSRFEKLDGGHFWLSETPDTIGSKSWDSSLPRMATWVKLRDKTQPDAPPIFFCNTHFDHKGPVARLESAKLIRQKLHTLGADCALLVTGDFNTDEGSEPYQALFAEHEGQPSPVVDSFRVKNPDARADTGTFSGFKAGATSGARIDWIGVSRDWTLESAAIDRTAHEGRTPSDHNAITAVLKR